MDGPCVYPRRSVSHPLSLFPSFLSDFLCGEQCQGLGAGLSQTSLFPQAAWPRFSCPALTVSLGCPSSAGVTLPLVTP